MSGAFVTTTVGGVRQRFELHEGALMTVGRASSCQIQIKDQSVSREHCVVVLAGDRIRVSNLASTHGIVRDGERVDQCDLEPGEHCKLGNAVFRFEPAAGKAAPPAREPEPEPESEPEPDRDPESGDEIDAAIAATAAELSVPTKEATTPQLDVKIAGYRVLEQLGAGGFATVYRAEHLRLGREVALKVLRLDDDADDAEERVAAFEREARAAAAIEDPHLVQVFDVGHDGNVHYLSMELVRGGSLAAHVRRHGPMEWRDVLAMIRDVASALQAAHARGLVHRDVKPANILLTDTGRAKLTDLGLASGEVAAGTVAFMAPEQVLRRAVDERSDLYALGCTAYAAMVGRAPFVGEKDDVARAHCREEPESFQRRGLKVPWHLEQLIIDAMMAKDPADRPANAEELLERLDRLVLPGTVTTPTAGRGASRRDPDAPVRVRVPASRQKQLAARLLSEFIIVTAIGLVIVALLLALKFVWDIDIYRLIGR